MKLKQEDRNLLREFFDAQSDWMEKNTLLTSENLNIFKMRFLDFIKSKNCEENLACKLLEYTLEHELLRCKERDLMAIYEESKKSGIRKAKLNYIPAVKLATDNSSILQWIKEARIVYEVSEAEISKLDASIKQKLRQNAIVEQESIEAAKQFHCY